MTQNTAATADGGAEFAVPTGVLGPDAPKLSYIEIQALVDRSANHNFYTVPDPSSTRVLYAADGNAVVGFTTRQAVHRFDIDMGPPSAEVGLQAANVLWPKVGELELRWMLAPWEFMARPDTEPPLTALDRSRSQRFAMQEMTLTLDPGTGFKSFGTGRTYPLTFGGRPQLSAAAVGNVMEGFGRYRNIEGNYTLCGELTADHGFQGHIMLRLVDPDGELRTAIRQMAETQPLAAPLSDPNPGTTFLSYMAQKGSKTKSENKFSLMPDGTPRGVNIPVDLKEVHLRAAALEFGPVIGLEVGFGRETKPRGPVSGSALDPFQFEGVSEYFFYDAEGRTIATFAANFLEGRTFAMGLKGAPGIPALRFSYYGIITGGTGFLTGLQGFLYGTAGSVFLPPPAEHVISNLYVARVADPGGRVRVGAL